MLKNTNRILTVLSFLFPFIVYLLTMAPTTSFWDCGEFIATSFILGVPHPPGSPLFLLLGNVFSSIPIFDDVGARVNLISPIVSALSTMFLYLIIVYLIEEYRGKDKDFATGLIVYFSAFIASVTFAFTDSQWFNAVESEVYALSTFFTSIVVWMILKWNRNADDNWNIRYLLIIIYMFGLAIGIHLLNLLTLPFVALIIYFKKFKFSYLTFLLTVILTILTFLIIYIGIIKGVPDITTKFGNLSFIFIFPFIVLSAIALLQISTLNQKYKRYAYLVSGLSFLLILFLILNSLFIKGSDAVSMYKQNQIIEIQNQIDIYDKEIYQLNNSANSNQLMQDLNLQNKINSKITIRNNLVDEFRILYDDYFSFEKIKDKISFLKLISYQPKSNLLIIVVSILLFCFIYFRYGRLDSNNNQNLYQFIFCSIFLILIGYSTYSAIFIRASQHPNINENNPDNIKSALAYMNRDQYGDWEILNWKSTIARPENTNWKRYTLTKNNPSFEEQMNFFIDYQIKEMYLRYFAWQFIGRGDKDDFPWYIKNLNGNLIGNQKLDGINIFRYGLPLAFILGILGIIFHFKNDWRRALSVLSLFLATGLMIILYLNQYDPQPRERDYSYVGSFFAFSIWIGIGLSSILHKIKDFFQNLNISTFISVPLIIIVFLSMPVKMLAEDYNEHSRKGNYVAWDYGYNLLNSCEPNGILFTNGDNDTFPLWYLQEVENIRKDVRVVNLSLLNTDWYIDQLVNQEPKLNLSFNHSQFRDNLENIDPYYATEAAFEICGNEYSDNQWDTMLCEISTGNNSVKFSLYPTLIGKLLRVQDYMILEIIEDIAESKPIYFAATVADRNQLGLNDYLVMEGMTYRLHFSEQKNKINFNKMKQNLMKANNEDIIYTIEDYQNAFTSGKNIYRYTNLNDTSIYYSDNIQRLVQNYRIGFIRLAQDILLSNISDKNEQAEKLVERMYSFFPDKKLPIEPGISLLISDSIYAKTGNSKKQKQLLKELFNKSIPLDTQIYLLYKFSDLADTEEIIELVYQLLDKYNDQIDFELQKYLGDILSDSLENDEFINLMETLLQKYPLKGMLFSLVRVYSEVGQNEKALSTVKEWLTQNPMDEDLLMLYDYLVEMNSFQ